MNSNIKAIQQGFWLQDAKHIIFFFRSEMTEWNNLAHIFILCQTLAKYKYSKNVDIFDKYIEGHNKLKDGCKVVG